MGLVTEWRCKPQIPYESISSEPGELPVEIRIRFLGTQDTYKCLKGVIKIFCYLWNYLLDKVLSRQITSARWY
jgi:hypothetical protein